MTVATRRNARTPWQWMRWTGGILAAVTLIACTQAEALLIRDTFDSGAEQVKDALEAHTPDNVVSVTDQPYRLGDADALLDVYFPKSATKSGARLPIVLWTHGGGWISGHKDDAAPYLQLIAARGYTVISVDYSLGPEHEYPLPLHQLNAALGYIQQNAARFHADPQRIVMAGDSAGAQITSQVGAMITNPAFAAGLGIRPAISPAQLRGIVLYCGIYDMNAFLDRADAPNALLYWGSETIVRDYAGTVDLNSPALRQMSTINHVTPAFPPTFISGGNADPLTRYQSRPLAAKLQQLGVHVTTLFYSPDHKPPLGHEYQFTLDNADGKNALQQMLDFLERHAKR